MREKIIDQLAEFYSFKVDNKFGLINENGEVAIQPALDGLGPWCNGCATFVKNGRVGLLRGGEVIIEPWYEEILCDGDLDIAVPMKLDGKWGYIRSDGSVLVKPQYQEALPYFDGMAAVLCGRDQIWGYLESNGNIKLEKTVGFPHPFSCGRKRMDLVEGTEFLEDGLFGYIEKSGAIAIPAKYLWASFCFSENRASVKMASGNYSAIDVEGNLILDERYEFIGRWSGGFAVARSSEKQWHILDINGGRTWSGRVNGLVGPRNGFVKMENLDGKCGLLSCNGSFIISPEYFDIPLFGPAQMATVQNFDGKYGAFDLSRKFLSVKCIYDNDIYFERGPLAKVSFSGRVNYISKNGDIIFSY